MAVINLHDNDYSPDDLNVKVSELLVATADSADAGIDTVVPEVLKLLKDRMQMDVVFVAEFVDGKRVLKHASSVWSAAGNPDSLEASWCQQIVDGRLAKEARDTVGSHLNTPVILNDGQIYGTMCCFSRGADEAVKERDLKNLQYSAQLTARKLEKQYELERQRVKPPAEVPNWSLEPTSKPQFR